MIFMLPIYGNLSDHIGRRLVMLLGLGASLIGTFLFAVAPDVLWLFGGRALTGIGVGLTAGTATAAMVDFSAEGQSKRAASGTTAAQTPRRCINPTAFVGSGAARIRRSSCHTRSIDNRASFPAGKCSALPSDAR